MHVTMSHGIDAHHPLLHWRPPVERPYYGLDMQLLSITVHKDFLRPTI